MLNHKTITQCNLLLVSVFHDVFKRLWAEAVGDEEDVTVTQFSSAYPIQGQRKGWSLPQL